MLRVLLIGAIGFGFGAIGLFGLRTIIRLLGYAILGTAFAIFVVALLFVSKVVVAHWLDVPDLAHVRRLGVGCRVHGAHHERVVTGRS